MKKTLSVLLACLLLAALMIPAFAASVSVTPKAVLSDDGVVTVTLDLPAGADLATFATTLTYDADKLEFSEVKFGAGDMYTSNTNTAGEVGLYMVWSTSQNTAATLATVTFKVKEDAAGTTDIAFKNTEATDSTDQALDLSFAGGPLSVTLSELPPVDEKIPSTAGRYAAIGSACAVVVAAAVITGVAVKRRKNAA